MIEFNATFLIAMLSFVIFILIMNSIFYNPILNIIRKREDFINSNYEDAKRFSNSAQEFDTTRQAKLSEEQDKCRHEFKSVISKTQESANAKLQSAREDNKQLFNAKKDELLKNEAKLKSEIETSVIDVLANSIVSKVFNRNDKEIVNR